MSSPTPLPLNLLTFSLVVKPGRKRKAIISCSLISASIVGVARFFCRIFSRIFSISIPAPSSETFSIKKPAACQAFMDILPVGYFPRAALSDGSSIPWSHALRSICGRGDSSLSRTSLSTGTSLPSISKITFFPADFAKSRTILGNI